LKIRLKFMVHHPAAGPMAMARLLAGLASDVSSGALAPSCTKN